MAIEKSHGSARPTLPRSSDLGALPAVPDAAALRSAGRDPGGRFTGGNAAGRGKGAKRAVAALMGRPEGDPAAVEVAASARVAYRAQIAELPHQGAIVSSLVAKASRHDALYGYYMAEAALAGLSTERGLALVQVASQHGQRAERLIISATDCAKSLANAAASRATWVDPTDRYMPSE